MTQSPGLSVTWSSSNSSAVAGLMRSIAACNGSSPVGSGMASDAEMRRRCTQFSRCILATRSGANVGDAGPDGDDAADAFGARGRRQRRAQPIIAAAKQDVSGVDRKSEHVEYDLARPRRADIGDLDATRNIFGHTVIADLDLLHRRLPSPGPCRMIDNMAYYAPDRGGVHAGGPMRAAANSAACRSDGGGKRRAARQLDRVPAVPRPPQRCDKARGSARHPSQHCDKACRSSRPCAAMIILLFLSCSATSMTGLANCTRGLEQGLSQDG